ncbi:hypothetical protein [Nocardia sp. NPDC056000]|uniref:hypothetical protein n=1 Tax=Nocardia sp. NPDC056000 TaxID=3345674 RepID=UPI0035D8F870
MVSQLIAIGAVLVGAMATYFATYLLTRQRNQYELSTRWDSKKLDAYEAYIDRVRANCSAAATLYNAYRRGAPQAGSLPESELRDAVNEAARVRSRAFERVVLLGSGDVVEAAHALNVVVETLMYQSRGEVAGAHPEWLQRFRDVFKAINVFHEVARKDLGVRGSVSSDGRPQRELLMPPGELEQG